MAAAILVFLKPEVTIFGRVVEMVRIHVATPLYLIRSENPRTLVSHNVAMP